MEIKSVSKPEGHPALEATGSAREVRKQTTTGVGQPPETLSRSAKYLLVKGKGGPLRPTAGKLGFALESIIGSDERERIFDTDLPPWRMICSLRMRGPSGGGAIGTGWLAGPRTVITAGHCVFSNFLFQGWVQEIEIVPGRNAGDAPFARFTSGRFSSVDRWVDEEDPDFDIGCIHLDEPVGDTVGWFAVSALPASELESFFVNISGYPSDRGGGEQQYFHRNRILRVTDRRIFYDVDTFGGQSGAPVWIHESDDSEPLVIGIHAYGVGGTPTSFGVTANSAPRITLGVLEQIQRWLDAH